MRLEPRVYAIADLDSLGRERYVASARAMLAGGVGRLQIRAKGAEGGELHRLLGTLGQEARDLGAEIWVDDRVDVAAMHEGVGVHLGQGDMAPRDARRILGPERMIGWSTHDLEQVKVADADPAVDLIAVGPIFTTRSKHDPDPVVGLEGLREARRSTNKPLVAIGGIGAGQICEVLAQGADAAAMIGAVCVGDPEVACRRLVQLVQEAG